MRQANGQKHGGGAKPKRIIRLRETEHRTGLSNATLWRHEQQGKFPKRVQITDHTSGHFEHEVEAYLDAPAALRDI